MNGDYCGDANFCDCRRRAEQVASAPVVLRCMGGCGLAYSEFPLDVLVSDDIWAAISGRSDGSGVMCASCIVKRAARLPGVTVAKLRFE